MEVRNPNNSPATPVPSAEPRQAPSSEPKKPQDNTAAKQAPRETGTAVQNTFGKVPQGDNAKQADTAAESPAAGQPKTNNLTTDTAQLPQRPVGGNAPGGESGPFKNLVRDPVKDAQGNPLKTPEGYDVHYDNRNRPVAVKDGLPLADPKGNSYAVGPDGKFLQPEAGKFAVYEKNTGLMVAVDADGKIAGRDPKVDRGLEGALALDKNGRYLKTPDGMLVGYDLKNGGKLAAYDPKVTDKPLQDARFNPYVIKPDGNYAVTASGNPVVYDDVNGMAAVAIDPKSGKAVSDANGHILAIGENGDFLKTPQGHTVVYNPDNGNKPAAIDPSTGGIHQDGSGNPYAILPDGNYAITENGEYVAHDKAFGNKPTAINPQTGESLRGLFGDPVAVGEDGRYIRTEDGLPVVYEQVSGKFNPTATNSKGETLVIEGYPIAVDKDGKQLFTPEGHSVVYDKKGNQVALGADNKVVTDDKGNTRALGSNAQFMPDVVYDKATGNKAKLDESGNPVTFDGGRLAAVDGNGQLVSYRSNFGGPTFMATYDGRGDIVSPMKIKTPGGFEIFENVGTGRLQASDPYGVIYKVDPATMDIAKDADGKVLPPVYAPGNNALPRQLSMP